MMSVGIFADILLGLITDVPTDAKLAEDHGLTATPASFALENGVTVSDHLVLNPATLEIPYELNNQDLPGTGVASSYGIRSALLFNLLTHNFNQRKLYTIVTRHKLYFNMAMIEMPATHAAPDVGTLRGTVKFQQFNLPNLQNVKVPKSQLAKDGTEFKASSSAQNAAQSLRDVANIPNLLEIQNTAFGGV